MTILIDFCRYIFSSRGQHPVIILKCILKLNKSTSNLYFLLIYLVKISGGEISRERWTTVLSTKHVFLRKLIFIFATAYHKKYLNKFVNILCILNSAVMLGFIKKEIFLKCVYVFNIHGLRLAG